MLAGPLVLRTVPPRVGAPGALDVSVISARCGGRAAVAGPQVDHLGCYRDGSRPGDDADDDVVCEEGYRYAEGDADTGEDGDQQPVARRIRWCHRCSPYRERASPAQQCRGGT